MLRQWRLTPTAFAGLPEDEQAALLGIELYRRRAISEWRATLIGDEGADKSKLSVEAATALFLAGV